MDIVDKAGELSAKIKALENELKKYKDELKLWGTETIIGNEYQAIVTTYNTDKLDIEMATKVAKDNNLNWILKEVVDEEALNDAILTEEINPELFKGCVVSKEITKIVFKKKGKK